ncbi:hypothetical protein [Saccharothrix syringae]|uniref:Uncharacterized protein n=1 Tax=Saccharothrix syringae TaxID=103733 RepID=A0A5Q0H060_SACSY|nr:hypothetical protein [Saccharothrix syringae]QFZ19641.1 hypothetical protein EKG83_21365 [Saccharothrix syringae]
MVPPDDHRFPAISADIVDSTDYALRPETVEPGRAALAELVRCAGPRHAGASRTPRSTGTRSAAVRS